MTQNSYTAQQDIEAARGKIADSTGKILNTNQLNCSVNLQKASLIAGTENEVIYRILSVLTDKGEEWNESLPSLARSLISSRLTARTRWIPLKCVWVLVFTPPWTTA